MASFLCISSWMLGRALYPVYPVYQTLHIFAERNLRTASKGNTILAVTIFIAIIEGDAVQFEKGKSQNEHLHSQKQLGILVRSLAARRMKLCSQTSRSCVM